MCNRYRPVSVTVVRDVFGFTLLEEPQPLYATQGIGPWQPGPFIRAGSAAVGQWGLIPWFSPARRPTGRGGRPMWWRFARRDQAPWALAGLWSEWTDPQTGEVVLSYTMLTQNCDGHPLLNRMHKPDPSLPPDAQDKRAVIPIERPDWDTWLHGSIEEAMALVKLPPVALFAHGPADPAVQVPLDLASGRS